ncbi:MAG: hypothetical protein PHI70_07360 [Proteiniphilum sp.]|nr:hypothetical protein [Proteiniphilum sp.]MDD3909069.1 hypothetical protein [Proteiniphilum sp.]MDD4416584.1 hypothetical protein [Proteiniphilum sp.]
MKRVLSIIIFCLFVTVVFPQQSDNKAVKSNQRFREYPINTVQELPVVDENNLIGMTAPSIRIYLPDKDKATGKIKNSVLHHVFQYFPEVYPRSPGVSPQLVGGNLAVTCFAVIARKSKLKHGSLNIVAPPFLLYGNVP